MQVLLIGGTGFTGPAWIRELLERRHEVVFLHPGQTHDARTNGTREIIGDRKHHSRLADAIAAIAPDSEFELIRRECNSAPRSHQEILSR